MHRTKKKKDLTFYFVWIVNGNLHLQQSAFKQTETSVRYEPLFYRVRTVVTLGSIHPNLKTTPTNLTDPRMHI